MCQLGPVTVELSTDQSTVIDYLAGFYPITATGAAAGGAGPSFWETMRRLNAAGAGWGMVQSVAAERSAASCCGHAGEIAELHGELADLRAGVGELARALARAGEEKTTGSGRASRLPARALDQCAYVY